MMENDATLAILAGGRGQRMGQGKAFLKLFDQPILEYLLDRFAWGGPTMLVSAPGRTNPPGANRFDREVVDRVEGEGPLRGLMTALENVSTPYLVVTTVDMPLVETMHLNWLLAMLELRAGTMGILIGALGRIEPFPSAYRKEARDVVASHLAAGTRSVHALADDDNFLQASAPGTWNMEMWTNLNQPADVIAFAAKLKH